MALEKEWQIKMVEKFWLEEELKVDIAFPISSFKDHCSQWSLLLR